MNAVEINACWVEAIRKEQKKAHLNENFSLNPKKLLILSDKPNNLQVVTKAGQKFEKTGMAQKPNAKEDSKAELDDELKQKL